MLAIISLFLWGAGAVGFEGVQKIKERNNPFYVAPHIQQRYDDEYDKLSDEYKKHTQFGFINRDIFNILKKEGYTLTRFQEFRLPIKAEQDYSKIVYGF